ncbi:hypothetical protein ACFL27_15740 [candidate division CSSED10-310 bacterium]|uniref:Type II toxin-antitoxin system HicB family antitoxin n=1 Tax=candidate division CSSED10-310 bacterium TaxID=2855610 RepID=A0ABV6YZM4_UNCC1
MMKYPYLRRLFFDRRDQTWVAVSIDLPGCSAGGETPCEALREFEIAGDAWLEACAATGKPLPRHTSFRSMKKEYNFSNAERGTFYHPDVELQIPIYLDPDVAEFIETLAEKKKTDIEQVVNDLLRKSMSI